MFDKIKYSFTPDGFWTRTNQLIREHGITQETIAKECNINYGTLKNQSSKKIMPTADEAVKIAQALNTTVEYLVTGNAPSESDNATAEVAAIKSEILEVLNRH